MDMERLKVEKNNDQFRILAKEIRTGWFPDTDSNRKAIVIFSRSLEDKKGKPLYTYKELFKIVGSENRQAASNHVEHFYACGKSISTFLTRRRKVDAEVVETVLNKLRDKPLSQVDELCVAVNKHLGRNDLTKMNISATLEQIPFASLRQVLYNQLSDGKLHYKEEYLFQEMMNNLSLKDSDRGTTFKQAGIVLPEFTGMTVSDPTAIRSLLSPNTTLSSIENSLQWICLVMALYYHGISLSVLSRWFNVHKTTVLRWIFGLGLQIWPIVHEWIRKQVQTKIVCIDEKWLKIRGKWYYWFVVMDVGTGLPILTSLLDSRGEWAYRWIGWQLKKIGQIPKAFITDGMAAYSYLKEMLGEGVIHLLCHFHYQQATSRWIKYHFKGNGDKEAEQLIKERKKELKNVLQTTDKRTVKRRFEKLKANEEILEVGKWVDNTEKVLPKLLPAIGSKKFPKTNNAIERFFRNFNQFYKKRCGFSSCVSAKRELICFLVMYLFVRQPCTGKAPLEIIMPQVCNMPFYKIINDPLNCLLGLQNVKQYGSMAKNRVKQCLRV